MAAQARFVRCPSCQWGTLADGNYCAYCGQPLRQAGAPQAPPQQPPQQAYRQPPGAGQGSTQQYYRPPGGQPQYYQPGNQPGTGPGFAQPGTHGPITCPNCGAMNDPWLTHCKQCTRPLMATG